MAKKKCKKKKQQKRKKAKASVEGCRCRGALRVYDNILRDLESRPQLTEAEVAFLTEVLTPAIEDPYSDPVEVLAKYYELRRPLIIIATGGEDDAIRSVQGKVRFVTQDGLKGEGEIKAITLDGVMVSCPKLDCGDLNPDDRVDLVAAIKAMGEKIVLKGRAAVHRVKCGASKCATGFQWVKLGKKYRDRLAEVVSLITLAELPDSYWR